MISEVVAGIGGVASLATAALGTYFSSKKAKQAEAEINSLRKDNKNWYDKEMHSDYLNRSDVQAILKNQRELLNEQYKRAKATAVVTGATDESLAMQQKAANDSISDTMTKVAGQASAHKDAVQQQYRQTDLALAQQQIASKQQQSANIAAAAGQGVSAGLNLVGSAIKKENN